MWIKWLLKRQKKKRQGKIDTVFAWKSPKKSKSSKGKKSRGKKSKGKKKAEESDQSSDEEVEIAAALKKINDADSERSELENRSSVRGGSPAPTDVSGDNEIELGSPASAPADWNCRISFLRFLSSFGPYWELISILEAHQVSVI